MSIKLLIADDEFEYCQQALRLGAKEYLLKPVRSSDILQMVNRAVDELFGVQEDAKIKPMEEKNHLVELAKEYMEEHYYENLMLIDVAQKAGISPGYLSTLFQKQLSKGFIDYLNEIRIEHACSYLQQNYLKTYEIAYKVGFKDEKYFSKVFKKLKGRSPSEYRRGNL